MTVAFNVEPLAEQLQIRVHGPASLPTLIYLPGLHGDWTIVGNFRRLLEGKVRFVELTYPRTLTWSLDDYASSVETALRNEGITAGWFLAESFSSLVVWQLLASRSFSVNGLILAGGFARHPARWGARFVRIVCSLLPFTIFRGIFITYSKLARSRFHHSPETQCDARQFIARRTELDQKAMAHRLRLVAEADFCSVASDLNIPIYAMTGLFDAIVPWLFVRRWLRKNCPSLREYKVISRCDHAVLANAPEAAAKQVLQWLGVAADVSRR